MVRIGNVDENRGRSIQFKGDTNRINSWTVLKCVIEYLTKLRKKGGLKNEFKMSGMWKGGF